jgi:hypothetical protein
LFKNVFEKSSINISDSGVVVVHIPEEEKGEMVKAFSLLLKKGKERKDTKISELLHIVKEVSITQSNLESIFLELCKLYN